MHAPPASARRGCLAHMRARTINATFARGSARESFVISTLILPGIRAAAATAGVFVFLRLCEGRGRVDGRDLG